MESIKYVILINRPDWDITMGQFDDKEEAISEARTIAETTKDVLVARMGVSENGLMQLLSIVWGAPDE